jgi:NDP-sugar pyrophosphorylase family protein
MRAMVMAAGAGTRLDPLTRSVPKPMVPVLNRPVISYTLENLKVHGIRECVLNLHSFPNQVKNFFLNIFQKKISQNIFQKLFLIKT